ncbi:hypothetical protein E3U43_021795 [Larimichthys crocea]|uniref:Uncharacterized protein n=1 Tax=Larimichthys crocea TaxID=215358 RepID=A0ACD3R7I6_LARCR|nr:hypothetical protein E3U43_021795 [Larimichthys crocea]
MDQFRKNKASLPPSERNGRKVLPCPAGGTPRLAHIPVFVGVYQEPHAPAQPLPRQGRAQPTGGGRSGGAQVAHAAGGERLGEVRTREEEEEDLDFLQLISYNSPHVNSKQMNI